MLICYAEAVHRKLVYGEDDFLIRQTFASLI
jgi:hypothetical protein